MTRGAKIPTKDCSSRGTYQRIHPNMQPFTCLGTIGTVQALPGEAWQDTIRQNPSKVQQTSQSASWRAGTCFQAEPAGSKRKKCSSCSRTRSCERVAQGHHGLLPSSSHEKLAGGREIGRKAEQRYTLNSQLSPQALHGSTSNCIGVSNVAFLDAELHGTLLEPRPLRPNVLVPPGTKP